jgi:ABC-type nitrate/sulfonate/bicarbonate transport system substrate-binding protein
VRRVSRRAMMATLAGGVTAIAAPVIVRAQSALSVKFVQQRGLLYLPIDVMVSGGVLQKEADKLGLGKIEASATTLSGPGPVIDAVLSDSADYGTAALPSLVTLWDRTHGRPNEVRPAKCSIAITASAKVSSRLRSIQRKAILSVCGSHHRSAIDASTCAKSVRPRH